MFWSQKDNQSNRKFQSSVEQSNFKFHFFFPSKRICSGKPCLRGSFKTCSLSKRLNSTETCTVFTGNVSHK